MEEKFYTAEQIAELLDYHPKTIRRYMREGKLKAVKAGGHWRVSEDDLVLFAKGKEYESGMSKTAFTGRAPQVVEVADTYMRVSAVLEYRFRTLDELARLSNTLGAVMVSKGPEDMDAGFTQRIDRSNNTARFTLWGTPAFIGRLLETVSHLGD